MLGTIIGELPSDGQRARKQAFILTREHTHEALLKIEAVQRTWEVLFGEPGDRGHYGRYQLLSARV